MHDLVLAVRSAPELWSRCKIFRSPHRSSSEHAGGGCRSSHDPCFKQVQEPKNERKKARKRNAERRVSNLRTLAGCGARRALRARLSASHHGTCCSERTPQLNPSYALPGTGLGRSGCYPLPAVLQCSGLKTADRSSCRPGVYAKVARVRQ